MKSNDNKMFAALESGAYHGFAGLIQWGGTEGWVEDADFELTVADWAAEYCFLLGSWHSPKKTMMILWRSGTWIDGTWEFGEWASGTWKNGTWLNGTWQGGSFDGGRWLDGVWINGDWNTANAEWVNGEWFGGRCINVRTGRWVKTGDGPMAFKRR